MVPNLRTEVWKFLGHIWSVRGSVGSVWGVCVVIFVINHVFVCMRPKMAMEIGFKKWNKGMMSGLPMDKHLLCFGTVKNSPRFV